MFSLAKLSVAALISSYLINGVLCKPAKKSPGPVFNSLNKKEELQGQGGKDLRLVKEKTLNLIMCFLRVDR